ncbi:hypothetical protein DEJ44_01935 [Streptomyces venezuelae]|nr:hypothetical protein DEJ44_01935 [Streptomyces venezuelae]
MELQHPSIQPSPAPRAPGRTVSAARRSPWSVACDTRTGDGPHGLQVARQEIPGGAHRWSLLGAHRTPHPRRTPPTGGRAAPRGPFWRSLVLHDLRYSAACLAESTREAGRLLRVVNTPYGPLDADAVEGADIAPAYHRHSSLWLA